MMITKSFFLSGIGIFKAIFPRKEACTLLSALKKFFCSRRNWFTRTSFLTPNWYQKNFLSARISYFSRFNTFLGLLLSFSPFLNFHILLYFTIVFIYFFILFYNFFIFFMISFVCVKAAVSNMTHTFHNLSDFHNILCLFHTIFGAAAVSVILQFSYFFINWKL